jgi:GAF domain-containing protein
MSEPSSDHVSPVELLQLVAQSPDLDAFLDRLVRLAARAVPAARGCGMTVRRDGQAFTAASSDMFAAQIDEIQYDTGEGPCLKALATGTRIQVDDLAGDERWMLFRPRALAHGMLSSVSLPLTAAEKPVAALNFYAHVPRAFHESDVSLAQALAAQCSAALEVILRQTEHAMQREQFDAAARSRSVIDQALGIIMAQQRCTATVAFELLRQASQHRNRKLRDVAADIVTAVTGQAPEPPSLFETR